MFLFIPLTFYPKFKYPQFKYISCSYLSSHGKPDINGLKNLNTSHVLIYLIGSNKKHMKKANLNTSHVLIYQEDIQTKIDFYIFKYISCSYLSY